MNIACVYGSRTKNAHKKCPIPLGYKDMAVNDKQILYKSSSFPYFILRSMNPLPIFLFIKTGWGMFQYS